MGHKRGRVVFGLALAGLCGFSPQVSAETSLFPHRAFSSLGPEERSTFWHWREEFSVLAQELSQPLSQLGPERRHEIFKQLEKEITRSHEPLRQLGAVLTLFYFHKAPLREPQYLLKSVIFSKKIPLPTRWVAGLTWLSHGGPHLSRKQRQTLTQLLNFGCSALARETAQLPQDPTALEQKRSDLNASLATVWLLDDAWLSWVGLPHLPGVSLSARKELLELRAFSDNLRKYRRWKAGIQYEFNPHQTQCQRALLTDIAPEDLEAQSNPLSRR